MPGIALAANAHRDPAAPSTRIAGTSFWHRNAILPNDIDVIGHMNNGRYMTIIDLALIEYLTRSGILNVLVRKGWRPMHGGSMISFRHGPSEFPGLHILRAEVLR